MNHQIPKSDCPRCFYRMDFATNANRQEQKSPKDGDFSVCGRCGEIMIFDEELFLRSATEDEIEADIETRNTLFKIQKMVREFHRQRNQPERIL